MAPTLEHVFDLRAWFDKAHAANVKTVMGGPQRMCVPIDSGFLKGSGLEAEVMPGSGDWFMLDPQTSTGHLDVRLNLRTSTGHSMYIHYGGILHVDDKSIAQLTMQPDAQSTEYGDHEYFVSPVIETGDPAFKWLEGTVFVAEGRFVVEGDRIAIEYEIYRVRKTVK